MRSNLRHFLMVILAGLVAPAFAQFSQDFEPEVGQIQPTRDALIQQDWLLPDMEINFEACSPITGAQSLVSGPSYKSDQKTGLVTPLLTFSNVEAERIAFDYKIHRAAMPDCRRWFLVYLVDSTANAYLVDSVEVDATSTNVVSYSKIFSGYSGIYSVYVNFRGDGCNARFVVDNFSCTGTNANIGHPVKLEKNNVSTGISAAAGSSALAAKSNTMRLFPNPVAKEAYIEMKVANSQSGQVEISALDGTLISTQGFNLNSGDNRIKIDAGSLASGSYYITIKTQEGIFTKRFMRVQ